MNLEYGPNVSPYERALIAGAYAGRGIPKWNLYWSHVRFASTLTGAGPFVYSIASGTVVQAFNYAQGASPTAGGLTSSQATEADTSMQQATQTINAENVLIRGLGIFLAPGSDPILAKQLDGLVSVSVHLGSTTYKLGNPSFSPAPGGLTGFSESMIAFPSPFEQFAKLIGGMTNGVPVAGNMLTFPAPLVWMPQGKGDLQNFFVEMKSQAAATQPANTEGAADRAAEAQSSTFSGTNAWTHPTAANTFVDYVVLLNHVPWYGVGP
jgi:hypothetical protein